MSSENNLKLIHLIVAGDESAFSELFYALKDRLYSLAFNITMSEMDADDVLQDVFITVWQNKDKLQDINNLDGYIYTMVKFRSLDLLKTRLAKVSEINEIIDANDPLKTLEMKEMNSKVHHAIANLPQKQKMVFQLYKEDNLPQKDIAKKMNITVSTVKNHVAQALLNIKKNIFF